MMSCERKRKTEKTLGCCDRGPGGGKTTAVDFFRREIGEQIVIVPEAATMIFSGGFPRESEEHARMAAQNSVSRRNRQTPCIDVEIPSPRSSVDRDPFFKEMNLPWSGHFKPPALGRKIS
jgi:hypothetical protein